MFIKTIILKHQNPFLLTAASIGGIIGVFMLLLTAQLFGDVKSLLTEKKDLLSDTYIVVSKPVSILNTAGVSDNAFRAWEIEEMKKQSVIEEVGVFTSNDFAVSAFRGEGERMPDLYTQLFFEAVTDNFLDVDTEQWQWNKGDTVLPIVVSSDYINLYNYGFAPSQGMPQISENMLTSLVRFNIRIKGNRKQQVFTARIVGFTDRYNSIMVPQSFMNWANATYGSSKERAPSRVILQVKDPSAVELSKFISENGYKTNHEKLKNSSVNAVLQLLTSVFASVAGVIILVSLLVFVLYSQLLLYKAKTEIQVLLLLGYSYKKIAFSYAKVSAFFFVVMGLLGLLLTSWVKAVFVAYAESDFGILLNSGLGMNTWLLLLVCIILFTFFNGISVFHRLRRIAIKS